MAYSFANRNTISRNGFRSILFHRHSSAHRARHQDIIKDSRIKKELLDFPQSMRLLQSGILNENGLPHEALTSLSDYLQLKYEKNNLSSLTKAWDKFFIRDISGQAIDRWDLAPLGLGQEWEIQRPEIIALLKNTGILSERFAQHQRYDTIIIHGARLEDIMPRLKFINQFWINGGRFKRIVVLTGERYLDSDERKISNWSFLPYKHTHQPEINTEIELMQYAWTVNNIIPPAVRKLPIFWINTPNFLEENRQIRRGNTEDTINAWFVDLLSHGIDNLGNCLAIANAPLILRQHLVFERKLHELGFNASIETVGLAEEQGGNQLMLYYLREISGLLWELNKLSASLSGSMKKSFTLTNKISGL